MGIDFSLFSFLNGFAGRSQLLDSIVAFTGDKLDVLVIILFLIFLKFISEKKKVVLTAVISTVLARGIITEIIRYFYHRPRPFLVMQTVQLMYEKNWSFPSGHTIFYFALAMSVYFFSRRWGILFFVLAGIIGVSRVIGGVHYPSDILGGVILGIASAYAGRFLVNKFIKS